MNIVLQKFGSILLSRPTGKEAYLGFLPDLAGVGEDEPIFVDFSGVLTLSPSWADEFITPLQRTFGERLTLGKSSNSSVELSLEMLEKSNGLHFRRGE